MKDLAGEYERLYPGAVPDEAQRQERMERLLHKQERQAFRRTTRTRGVIIRWLPLDEHGRLKP